eukprot:1832678-Rhodomonas_salina.1
MSVLHMCMLWREAKEVGTGPIFAVFALGMLRKNGRIEMRSCWISSTRLGTDHPRVSRDRCAERGSIEGRAAASFPRREPTSGPRTARPTCILTALSSC